MFYEVTFGLIQKIKLKVGGGLHRHTWPAELIYGNVRGNRARIILSLWDCIRIVSVGGKCSCSFLLQLLYSRLVNDTWLDITPENEQISLDIAGVWVSNLA